MKPWEKAAQAEQSLKPWEKAAQAEQVDAQPMGDGPDQQDFLGRLYQQFMDSTKSMASWQIPGYTKEFVGGATMGFADEGAARVASNPLLAFGGPGGTAGLLVQQGMTPDQDRPTYDEAYQTAKQQREAFREENPLGAPVTQILGGAAMPGGLANAARQSVAKQLPGMGFKSRVARAAPTATAAGTVAAVTGMGEGDPGQRTDDIVKDFFLGAGFQRGAELLGPATKNMLGPSAGLAFDKAYRFLQKALSPDDAAQAAMKTLGDTMDSFKLSEKQIDSLQKRLFSQKGPTALAAESAPFAQLSKYLVEQGYGQEFVTEINRATRKAGERIASRLRNGLSMSGKETGLLEAQNIRGYIREAREHTGKEQYAKAFKEPFTQTKELNRILSGLKKNGKGLISEIEEAGNLKILAETGIPTDYKLQGRNQLTLEGWDFLAKLLGDLGDGTTQKARYFRGIRKRLINELDQLSPTYASARAFWRGTAEAEELLDFGRALSKGMDEGEIQKRLYELKQKHGRSLDFEKNPHDRDLVVLGLTEGLQQGVINKSGASVPDQVELVGRSGPNPAQSVFDKERVERAMRLVLGDKGTDQVYELIFREQNLKQLANTLNHATATSAQNAIAQALEGRALASIPNELKRFFDGLPRSVRAQLAEDLLSTNTKVQKRALFNLRAAANSGTKRRAIGNYASGIFVNPFVTGSAAARYNDNSTAPEE